MIDTKTARTFFVSSLIFFLRIEKCDLHYASSQTQCVPVVTENRRRVNSDTKTNKKVFWQTQKENFREQKFISQKICSLQNPRERFRRDETVPATQNIGFFQKKIGEDRKFLEHHAGH